MTLTEENRSTLRETNLISILSTTDSSAVKSLRLTPWAKQAADEDED